MEKMIELLKRAGSAVVADGLSQNERDRKILAALGEAMLLAESIQKDNVDFEMAFKSLSKSINDLSINSRDFIGTVNDAKEALCEVESAVLGAPVKAGPNE
jgi:hypothetical protein